MKKYQQYNDLRLRGIKKDSSRPRVITYLLCNRKDSVYAFSRDFTKSTWDLVKSGIRVDTLLGYKTRDASIMNLVKCSKRLIPYLVDFYELTPS